MSSGSQREHPESAHAQGWNGLPFPMSGPHWYRKAELLSASNHWRFPFLEKIQGSVGGLGLPWMFIDGCPSASQAARTLVPPGALLSCIICRQLSLKIPDSLGTEDFRSCIYLGASRFIWRAVSLLLFLDYLLSKTP